VERPPIRYTKTVDGLHIAYQVMGDGPFDLLYTPGWMSNLECAWEVPELGAFLTKLAGMSRLILFDRRGFGLSDSPPTGSWSLELGMDDIRAVLDAAGSERAVLFGTDEGGALCTLFAASDPGRVSALVLFAVWAAYFSSSDYPWGWTKEQDEAWMQRLESHWGTEEFWEDSAYVSPRVSADPIRVRTWARYARLSASRGAAVALGRMQAQTDIRAVLPTVTVPTLVMHRLDDTAEPVGQARYIGEHMPNAEVIGLPGDEHAPFAGDVERVLQELQRFVAAVRDEEAELDRVLATVLFTDLVGSTEQAAALGDRACASWSNDTTRSSAGCWHATEGPRSIRPATASSRHSTARPAQCDAGGQSSTPSSRSDSTCERESTPARSRRSMARQAGSLSTSALGLLRRPHRASFSCHRR
jgi:pimeloyl-ACP methyl ester carboxylesterase